MTFTGPSAVEARLDEAATIRRMTMDFQVETPFARESADIGREAHALVERLYPICRSLTGNGVRRTLRLLQDIIPLEIHEVPTGTRAFDWIVPDEWNVRDAYVKDSNGRRVIDFNVHNLHLAGYSAPVHARMTRAELLEHVFTDPLHPDWIPYRNFFYRDGWGFCIPHSRLPVLSEAEYEVCIDTNIGPGSLTYGELVLKGEGSGEILVSTHTCHPSLCNDNLSGVAVAALLARALCEAPRRMGFRFIFAPATLGALVWLSRNEQMLGAVRGGLVVAGVGDSGPPTYLRSRRGTATIDRAVAHVLRHEATDGASTRDFAPVGYDQRQYCSPGFDLPVGCFMRTPNGEYPEYHTSADDMTFVKPESLGSSWQLIRLALDILQDDCRLMNLCPRGEPRLGPHGLFAAAQPLGLFWILNFSDGHHSLLDIAERSGMPFWRLREGARRLEACGLVRRLEDHAIN